MILFCVTAALVCPRLPFEQQKRCFLFILWLVARLLRVCDDMRACVHLCAFTAFGSLGVRSKERGASLFVKGEASCLFVRSVIPLSERRRGRRKERKDTTAKGAAETERRHFAHTAAHSPTAAYNSSK